MMRRGAMIRGSLLAAIVGLAACSGGNDRPSANVQLLAAGRAIIKERLAGEKAAPPTVTRELLDTLDGAYMEATLENYDLTAYLFVNAQHPDRGNGPVTVWRTYDEVTLGMRNGVLIATRGLGGDLLSTELKVPSSRPGPADTGHRVQHIRDDDDGVVTLPLACGVTDLGPETIDIIGHRHATRRLEERCEGAGGVVINEYWIESASRIVWQSRQWGGPHVGYLRFRRLTK